MRRRLFAAKAERLDTAQLELELELGQKLAALDALNRELGLPVCPPRTTASRRRRAASASRAAGATCATPSCRRSPVCSS